LVVLVVEIYSKSVVKESDFTLSALPALAETLRYGKKKKKSHDTER